VRPDGTLCRRGRGRGASSRHSSPTGGRARVVAGTNLSLWPEHARSTRHMGDQARGVPFFFLFFVRKDGTVFFLPGFSFSPPNPQTTKLAQVQSLLHRDPTRRPGVVLVARLTSASPEKAMEVFLGGDDTNRLGGVARQVLDVRHVGASLDALACSRWVTHVRVRTEGITDASEIGGAVASAVADAFGDTTKKSATLVELDFDVEDDLDLDKTREALRDARDALGGPGGGAVVVLLVTGVSVEGKRSVQSVKRRRLSQDENDAAASAYSYSNGNATRVQEKTDSFRDSVTMAAVFGILLVTALCGILAMTTMTFPSDSLLYPREKNE
jgi:hypothetical protein